MATLIDRMLGVSPRARKTPPVEQFALDLDGRSIPVRIIRHPHSRRLTMRLAHGTGGLVVNMPRSARLAEAQRFVIEHQGWIRDRIDAAGPALVLEPGASLSWRGETVRLDWRADGPRAPALDDGALVLGGPMDHLRARVLRWMKAEALVLVKDDLRLVAARAGLSAPSIRLSSAQRRWGSCSAQGEIRINWRLVQAPDNVRRSVVAHEVAHLRHMDHSRDFYAWLDQISLDSRREADAWLKAHGSSLYAIDRA